MRITSLETILVKPRWLFLKMHTDEGLVGLGEPLLEGRGLTCAQAIKELLESKGIPVEIRCFQECVYDNGFIPRLGLGEIVVPPECETTAQRILDWVGPEEEIH